MIQMLLRFVMRRFLRTIRFPEQVGEESKTTTEEILRAFESGFYAALRAEPETVGVMASQIAWDRRDFFWEGVSMGLAGLHALRFSRGNPDRRRLTHNYRQIHFTGYGFWHGIGRIYHLPVLPLDEQHWRDTPDFAKYGPLIAGGAGFASVIMSGTFHDKVLDRLKIPPNQGWEVGAIHGCGRALWFLLMHNIPRLTQVLAAHPRHAEALLEGLGAAVAYTHMARPQRIIAVCDGFSPPHREILLRGVGAALTHILEYTPESLPYIKKAAEGPFLYHYEICLHALRQASPGREWYESYINLIREGSREAAELRLVNGLYGSDSTNVKQLNLLQS